jgi:hypothetical protein
MGKRTLAVAVGVIVVACSGPPPTPPAAVIAVSPASVCAGDGFKTPIHLDALASSPRLTLVYTRPDPDAGALKYSWAFSGDDVQIDPGSVEPDGTIDGDTVLLKMAGERPLHVTLTVTNAAMGVTAADLTISVTPLAADGTCPLPQSPP